MGAGGEAALHEVAAGGGFPVDHFPGEENAGELLQHEGRLQLIPAHAAGGGDGLIERPGAAQRNEAVFRLAGEGIGIAPNVAGQDGGCGFGEFPADSGFGQEVAAYRLHFPDKFGVGESGLEVDGDGRLPHRTKDGPELIDRAAFEAVAGDHQLADGDLIAGADLEVF